MNPLRPLFAVALCVSVGNSFNRGVMYRQRSMGDVSGQQIQSRAPNSQQRPNAATSGAAPQNQINQTMRSQPSSAASYEDAHQVDPEPTGNRWYQHTGVEFRRVIPGQDKNLSLSYNSDQRQGHWDRSQPVSPMSNMQKLPMQAPSPPSYIPMPPPNAATAAQTMYVIYPSQNELERG
jgi:hypothetical protein